MAGSLAILPYEPAHRPGLLRLWTRFFGAWSARRLEQRWAWQFEQNPFRTGPRGREPVILIALSGADVVGHLAGIPIPMLLGGEEHIVLAASGLVTEKAHPLAGFSLVRSLMAQGPVLANAMTEDARKLMIGCGATLIPESRVRFVYPRRYGGHLAMKVRRRLPRALSRLIPVRVCAVAAPWYVPRGKPRPRPLPPRITRSAAVTPTEIIRPIERFDEKYDALWSRLAPSLRWSIAKTARYMNWRYTDCPTADPVRLGLFDARSGELGAVAVGLRRAHNDRFRRPCLLNGEIAEFLALNPEDATAEALLATTMHTLDGGSVDSISSSYMQSSVHPLFRRLGFMSEDSAALAAAFQTHPILPSDFFRNPDACYYTAGDGDGLYSSGL